MDDDWFARIGRSLKSAMTILQEAKRLEEAGCFAIVIECVPAAVADIITKV